MTAEDTDIKRTQPRSPLLSAARRVVVKVGTNVVTGHSGGFSTERLESLVASIAEFTRRGMQVVLVSSGAVGLGRDRLKLHPTRTLDLVTRQACAAVGQALLMEAYQKLFAKYSNPIAQVLLTEGDFIERHRSSNLRGTMEKLLKMGVVPIVNENDTVSTAELQYIGAGGRARVFSDNDRLAALVASKLDANALILLTNVEGLLQRVKGTEGKQAVIPLVEKITPELKALASGPSAGGRGGMQTKLEAAEIAMTAGSIVVIASGNTPGVLERILHGEAIGTTFVPAARMAGRRRWIAYAADVRGRVAINAGAQVAITRRKASLLWSGVTRVDCGFKPLDVVSITDAEGRELALGLANFGSDDARKIDAERENLQKDKRSSRHNVLVSRDNIVVLETT